MSDLFDNAIVSIKLGIEDFKSNDDRRPVSAVRNFYAGVLLLGKQCLINAAPNADPMEILASRFVPIPDDEGGVRHEPKGFRTIDFHELRERFKSLDLKWPSGNIDGLQKLRNELEHYHSAAPTKSIQQAIAECFPLVEGFFQILDKDPASSLGEAWEVMLAEEQFFQQRKAECDASFGEMPWSEIMASANMIECTECGSSLISQLDPTNADPASIVGKCIACSTEHSAEQTVKIIVDGKHGIDDYIMVKDGGEQVIHDCPECYEPTYVFDGDTNECYFCGASVNGECALCRDSLTVTTKSINDPELCDYCSYKMNKVMKE